MLERFPVDLPVSGAKPVHYDTHEKIVKVSSTLADASAWRITIFQ